MDDTAALTQLASTPPQGPVIGSRLGGAPAYRGSLGMIPGRKTLASQDDTKDT